MQVEFEKLLGLTKERAIALLEVNGNEWIILREDDKLYGRIDFIASRFNLIIDNNRVSKVLIG